MNQKKQYQDTEESIKQAIVYLINQEGLDKITVRQITAYAQINRTTFYRHYLDKPDLIDQYRSRILTKFQKIIDIGLAGTFHYQDPHSEVKPYPMFAQVIKMMAAQLDFYRAWLGDHGDQQTRDDLLKMFHQNFIHRLHQLAGQRQEAVIPMDFACELIVEQLWAILNIWLHQDSPMSAEKVIDITMKTRFASPYELAGFSPERGER